VTDDKDIFTRVRAEDTAQLFVDLTKIKGDIVCKGKDDNIIKLKCLVFDSAAQIIECRTETGVPLNKDEEILANFFLGAEKYYFKGRLVSKSGLTQVTVQGDVFHLQRRQTYRVHIPDTHKSFYNIVKVNDRAQAIPGQLADLSGGGCRVIYRLDTPLMKMGDQVTGQLVIGNRAPLEIDGEVRHIKVDATNKVIQTFGIEFKNINSVVENKIFAITMELYKEIFKNL
jgi:c-di-GMP-binding flagellar brake protein YcgR